MDGSVSDFSVEPFRRLVVCRNITCAHVGVIYEIQKESAVGLKDTGLREPMPKGGDAQ